MACNAYCYHTYLPKSPDKAKFNQRQHPALIQFHWILIKMAISQCSSTAHSNIQKYYLKETFWKIQTLAFLCFLLTLTVHRSRIRSGEDNPHHILHRDQG